MISVTRTPPEGTVSTGFLRAYLRDHPGAVLAATCPACGEIEQLPSTQVLRDTLEHARDDQHCVTRCPYCTELSWVTGTSLDPHTTPITITLLQELDTSLWTSKPAETEPEPEPEFAFTPPPLPPVDDDEAEEDLPAAWSQE